MRCKFMYKLIVSNKNEGIKINGVMYVSGSVICSKQW